MEETSIFEKKIDPLYQAGAVLVIVFVFDVIGSLIARGSEGLMHNRWAWLVATSFLLFFAVVNAVMSAASDNMIKYWGRSLYSYMGLVLGATLLAWFFSGTPINQAGSFKWIIFVVTFAYIVFMGMIAIIKNVVGFAQREEWNKPKLRSRKRRP